jgi:hypothetical protein
MKGEISLMKVFGNWVWFSTDYMHCQISVASKRHQQVITMF